MSIYDLEKLVKKEPNEAYKQFADLIDQKRYMSAINYLKKSGLFLSDNSNLIRAIDGKLFATINKKIEYHEFMEQYNIIMYINSRHRCNEKNIMSELDNKLEKNKQPIALLYSAASLIEENPYKNSLERKYFDYNENIVSAIGILLKIYLYKKNDFVYTQLITKSDIENMKGLTCFATMENAIKTMNDIWRFSDFKMQNNDSKIVLQEVGDFGKSLRVSQTNFLDILYTKYKRLGFEYKFNSDNFEYDLVYFEIMKNLIEEYFYTNDLNQEYDGVSLNDWMRAYIKIVELGNSNLNNTVVIKNKDDWKSLFIKIGIKEKSLETIINNLMFTTKSKDLFDCPLIKFDCGIAFIPIIASIINPVRSMLSLLSSKNAKINQKGSNFEVKLKNILSKCGIKAINMKEHDYELDLVFKIDNDLFIVEAKTMNQPTNHWEFMRYQDEIDNYVKKFKRNYTYFCEDTHLLSIKKRLKMNSIKNVFKIFVSNILDTRSKIGDIYITNDTIFEGYFLKNEPMGHVLINKTMISSPLFSTDAYKGKITGTQFIKLIEDNPFSVKDTKRVIYDNYTLPYNVQLNHEGERYLEIKRYGFKEVDMLDLFTD